jgi:hypothetical protein
MRNAPAKSLKKAFRLAVLIGSSRLAFCSLSPLAGAFAAYLAGRRWQRMRLQAERAGR